MGLTRKVLHQNGSTYEYEELRYSIPSHIAKELYAIPKNERKQEVINRLEAGSLREQIKELLTDILSSTSITLPEKTKETAADALRGLGGLY